MADPPYPDMFKDKSKLDLDLNDQEKLGLLSAKWHTVHAFKFPHRLVRYMNFKYRSIYNQVTHVFTNRHVDLDLELDLA